MKCIVVEHDQRVTLRIRETLVNDGHHRSDVILTKAKQAAFLAAQVRPKVAIVVLPDQGEGDDELLQDLQDIKESHPVHIVAIGPTDNSQRILRILSGGANQYIDVQHLESEIPLALRKLRTEVPVAREQGRVISVVGATGGCGASTVAVNVSATLARIQGTCGLMDMHLEASDLATMVSLTPTNTVASFCRHLSRMDDEIFRRCLVKHDSGISLLAGPANYRDTNQVTSRGSRKALSMLRQDHPTVIVDLNPPYGEISSQFLIQSDVILVVMRLDFTAIRRLGRILDYTEEMQIGRDRIRLVVNRFRRTSELSLADAKKAVGMEIISTIPDDVGRVGRANNLGIPVVLLKPRAPVSRAFSDVAKNIVS